MEKEIRDIQKNLKILFSDLEKQNEFEKSFKEELKDKKNNKYVKNDIESKLNTVYDNQQSIIEDINRLTDRFNYLTEDNFYIKDFDLNSFSDKLCIDCFDKIEKVMTKLIFNEGLK